MSSLSRPNSAASTRPHHTWQPDSTARKCTICQNSFGLIRRRHHCRRCGTVVCNDCSLHRLRIPVARIAVDAKHAPSINSLENDEMDVVRVCDTCYSKHQQLKSKRKARAASIENHHLPSLTHLSRQSSRHSSPSSTRSSIQITNEHNQPITHQLLRPASSGQLSTQFQHGQPHHQPHHHARSSPHSPAQESVLPSVPSLPRTPRQLDDTTENSKQSTDQRVRSHSSSEASDALSVSSSSIKRSLSSASQVMVIDDTDQPTKHTGTRRLKVSSSTNQPASTSPPLPPRQSPTIRAQALVLSADFMSPKNVHHRTEFVAPAWCDNVLAATGITLPTSTETNNNSINESMQTETFMDSLTFLSWIRPLMTLLSSFAGAFSDRPVACLLVIPLVLLIIHRLRPWYQTLLVIMQLFSLHNAIWRLLSTNGNTQDRPTKQIIMSIVHACLHDSTTLFQSSSSTSSDKQSIDASRDRAMNVIWICFGFLACYVSYFVSWPLFWSACIVKDLTRAITRKQKMK